MRHRKHHGSLGLVTGHRRALLANLASALITHGRIETTQAKARAVRPYIEKLITLGKNGDLHSRRQALAKLRHRPVVDKLFDDVAAAFGNRPGGYTRIIKTGFRVGDAAPMAMIELVEAGFEAKPAKAVKKPAAKKEAAPAKQEEAAPVEAAAAETTAEVAVEAEAAAEETKASDK
ncbi:MAG: 50S ribosomal protein L17 [Zetaproteobacteria bacterium CG06_land_8_20_14_3_00_59_53]|nr:MAG: 50S ribosomal protein L17 [Zetaproteobacteria bacterium CG2_30_59_37]PIO90358.1 MAG: 50S ribosomal protein L17 [Zetaproteobacteria bacterium CG23_combo_of_CG06-09_8_20_14_all_59_86]PIQ65075.1 MAG: 50S ribosomal protein L17 [Zetaproteobacteria bacterium CG11_big_fil_rev_8_21_14_0_20_59_439]PIU70172.1 MAG: 50S ribosomal protein L17 [Zetaproteobacteria bacterium CG06_land_8_20_14_3_00_59_53]PIU96143.1 MAG: 50S ribosomal protein L17 [Zetaproteobacteria bacterium CG03_land_8_20_14_0_80_59_51